MSDEEDDGESRIVRHVIYVAELKQGRRPYAVLTQYERSNPINAVGEVWNFVDLGREDGLIDSGQSLISNDNLSTIWASPEGNLWVGGKRGTMWTTADVAWKTDEIVDLAWQQFDPAFSWKATTLPRIDKQSTYNVTAIWGSSDRDIHAGTFDGGILHWDGAQWRASFVENQDSITRMHGTSASDVWAVGSNGLVLHFDGKSWRRLPLPGDVRDGEVLTGVWARSPQEVFICARSGAVYNGNAHGLTLLREFKREFYGIVEVNGTLYLSAGDQGVAMLRGNKVEIVKDTFATAGVYALDGRVGFVKPLQDVPNFVMHDQAAPFPWFRWECE